MEFSIKSTGVGCHFLLQGIFPTQRWNPGLLHCRQTLYHLSYQESPLPRKESYGKPAFPSLAGRCFTTEPPGKAMTNLDSVLKSRDITFPTKVRIVKAMIFQVVMQGCKNWTTKKQISGGGGGQKNLVGDSPWGCKEADMTIPEQP